MLPIIKEHDMVLASGHMSPKETFALEAEARGMGIDKFVVTHPLDHEFFSEAFSKQDLIQLAKNGAFIECTFLAFQASEFRHDPAEMVDVIKAVGAEKCIMSTDLGQIWNPLPVEGMRMFIVTLIKYGISEEEIILMAKKNPAKLLGLNA
jgi:imidazolonepropionase-like amidohydrolase